MQTFETEKRNTSQRADCPLAPTDSELLLDFVLHRRQEAFAELVGKHAAMVLGVCRQILRDRHEAEDVFQATFVILAERAGSIKNSASVGAWLHQVAYRTAMRAAKRRQLRQTEPLDDVPGDDDIWNSIARQERQSILHEELARLPDRYRAALVLCYLEGMSRGEAAEELECTESSLKASLARARRMLRVRLAKRGILLSAAIGIACSATMAAQASSLPSLVAITAETVAGSLLHGHLNCLTTNIGSLAREGVAAMKMTAALRIVVPVLLTMAVGTALLLSNALAGPLGGGDSAGVNSARFDGAAVIQVAPTAAAAAPDARSAILLAADDTTAGSAGQGINPNVEFAPALAPLSPFSETAAGQAPAAYPSETDEERALEIEYLQAKIEAMKLYAKAKHKKADHLVQRIALANDERLIGAVSKAELRGLDAEVALARAEAVNMEAELIRLRRELLIAQRMADAGRAEADSDDALPRTISEGDVLVVESVGGDPNSQDREVRVERGGTIPLGPAFGRVNVKGLTLTEAEDKVKAALLKHFSTIEVQITYR